MPGNNIYPNKDTMFKLAQEMRIKNLVQELFRPIYIITKNC